MKPIADTHPNQTILNLKKPHAASMRLSSQKPAARLMNRA